MQSDAGHLPVQLCFLEKRIDLVLYEIEQLAGLFSGQGTRAIAIGFDFGGIDIELSNFLIHKIES